MPKIEFLLPKMGESIMEATILSWSKIEGEAIEKDETLLEIATDKVDTELPSPYHGILISRLYEEGAIVKVGMPVAIIETEDEKVNEVVLTDQIAEESQKSVNTMTGEGEEVEKLEKERLAKQLRPSVTSRFYSPLIRSIAEIEKISIEELDQIHGTGSVGRVTKEDLVGFITNRNKTADKSRINYKSSKEHDGSPEIVRYPGETEIVEMDRTRKLIAAHMVRSKQTSPHVTSFLEIDVTNLVKWRTEVKSDFLAKYNEKLTYTPCFVEAVAKAIGDFPMINVSVDQDKIIIKKFVNIGMATETKKGALIVPVIKNADQLDLIDLAKTVNDLALRARERKLKPEEIEHGTFTLTNVGGFGNTLGTPIINQPQVAILSTGAIRKRPAVVEYPGEERIEVRHMMFLSLSYDHRVVDGALGGRFLRRVGDYLESFDVNRVL